MIKRLFVSLIFFIFILGRIVSICHALDFPRPEGYVNDFAGILSSETRQTLEQKLIQLEKDSIIEIAVVTIKSLEGSTIEDYAVYLFEDWKIGKKGKDNGVLFLIAPTEKKLRIEVGYGLEPTLTDSKAGRIIRDTVTPQFKKGNYDSGVTLGVEEIIKVARGETVDLDKEPLSDSDFKSGPLLVFFIIIVIFLSYLSSFLARSKSFWLGGVLGAGLGAGLGLVLFTSLLITAVTVVFLGILGLLFDYVLSKNYKVRKSKNLPTTWWKSGGGFFGGGGSSKGFGGFGGGSSGGGGASGSW